MSDHRTLKTPLKTDGQYIYDADSKMVAEVRGWGRLTGCAALALPQDEAIDIQGAWLRRIVAAVNATAHINVEYMEKSAKYKNLHTEMIEQTYKAENARLREALEEVTDALGVAAQDDDDFALIKRARSALGNGGE